MKILKIICYLTKIQKQFRFDVEQKTQRFAEVFDEFIPNIWFYHYFHVLLNYIFISIR